MNSGEPLLGLPAEDDAIVEYLIVLRAQLGDRDAFTLLLDRHHERLLEYVQRLLRSRTDAEDVLQEVWITVVRKIPTLDQPLAFRAWLYRIARNRVMSRLRTHHREVTLEVGEREGEFPAAAPDEEDSGILSGFAPEAVRGALDALSPAHREVLTLRFFDDFSYADIAEITGCGVGTVRSRIHYAKKALQRKLATVSDHRFHEERTHD